MDYAFLHFDDNAYITENRHTLQGLTPQSIITAFAQGHNSSWHPLAMLSHMADVEFFGLDPGAHHAVNVLLHAVNTVLLYFVLRAMTAAPLRCAVVAALFAIHPLHVEPVAWISSRKDVLSTLFMMLALAAYIRYARTASIAAYSGLAVAFTLGLLAKPMLVTLPFVLLLLDYWPLQRLTRWTDIRARLIEKTPLFGLMLLCVVATMYFQSAGGAVKSMDEYPLGARLTGVIVSYTSYLQKTFWPSDLAVYYPHMPDRYSWIFIAFGAALLAAITIYALIQWKKRPYLLTGWLWFAGVLVPVSGLVQFGSHISADRYTYVSLIGLFIGLVWFISEWAAGSGLRRRVAMGGAAFAVAASLVLAMVQVRHWKNDATLWAQAVRVTPPTALAYNKLGHGLLLEGKTTEAVEHLEQSLELAPGYVLALNNLGAAYASIGQFREATEYFRQSVEQNPENIRARVGLGQALAELGRATEAKLQFSEALALDPGHPDAHYNLGLLAGAEGDLDGAIDHYQAAVRHPRPDPAAYVNLGNALARKGELDRAISAYQIALSLDPARALAHLNLGNALLLSDQKDRALEHFKQAVALDPSLDAARMQLDAISAKDDSEAP